MCSLYVTRVKKPIMDTNTLFTESEQTWGDTITNFIESLPPDCLGDIKDAKTGKYILHNPQLAELYGKIGADIRGLTVRDASPHDNPLRSMFIQEIEEQDRRVRQTRQRVQGSRLFSAHTNQLRIEGNIKTPILGRTGQVIAILHTVII
jgi:hypothetical protein